METPRLAVARRGGLKMSIVANGGRLTRGGWTVASEAEGAPVELSVGQIRRKDSVVAAS